MYTIVVTPRLLNIIILRSWDHLPLQASVSVGHIKRRHCPLINKLCSLLLRVPSSYEVTFRQQAIRACLTKTQSTAMWITHDVENAAGPIDASNVYILVFPKWAKPEEYWWNTVQNILTPTKSLPLTKTKLPCWKLRVSTHPGFFAFACGATTPSTHAPTAVPSPVLFASNGQTSYCTDIN